MDIKELKVYNRSMDLAEQVWQCTNDWDYFSKQTIGLQLIRAVDSIAANLSEGYGRYHFKESKKFCYYARGSLLETKTWLTKANHRQMINNTTYSEFIKEIDIIGKMLNKFISSIGTTNSHASEPSLGYSINEEFNDEFPNDEVTNNQ